jgi:formylglycine-generating enzyme required for sulfatase activity
MLEKDKKVGEYYLVEKLGSGGFGEVWKAEKRSALSISYFALKFFRPNKDAKIDLGSVKKEVQVWQTLSGLPNVISVIEANIFEDYVYIVSDFAEGGSLEDWLKANGGKANSVEEAVTLTKQILQGLEGMHRAGFVHRDLKPANILIKKGILYLADFGLSREMKTHSQTTSAAGTIGFMPPEAFAKKPTVSVHTDIWASGVILQKLLTGELPFPQDDIPSLITSILMEEPEPMPEEVPQPLKEIVRQALQKKREDRFQWAREMIEALQETLIPKEVKNVQQNLQTEQLPAKVLAMTVKSEVENESPPVSTAKPQKAEAPLKLTDEKLLESQMTVTAPPPEFPKIQVKREIVRIPQPPRPKIPPNTDSKSNFSKKIGIGLASILLVGVLGLVGYRYLNANDANNLSAPKTLTATPSNKPHTFKNSTGMEFVKLPPGLFLMGSPANEWQRGNNESPQREVIINYEFYLGKYEVTQEEYEKVTGANPSTFKNCPRCPVENVSWHDAKDFIAKLNAKNDGYEYRLPSEAEWEYASRAGKSTPFSLGDGNNLSSDLANFDGRHPFRDAPKGRYLESTTAVGSYPPNPFGLFDLNGNVWEWCEDIYQENYEGLGTDGSANLSQGDSNSRILRGGGWVNIGNGVRSAVRLGMSSSTRLHYYGFRVAVSIK